MKKTKLFSTLPVVTAFTLALTITSFALATIKNERDAAKLADSVSLTSYNSVSIKNDFEAFEKSGKMSRELKSIICEPSYNIKTPKIDLTKVKNPTKIADLKLCNAFYEELDSHGVVYDRNTITYSEYCDIENTWSIDEDTLKEYAELYPELENIKGDLNYGTALKYQIAKDKQDFGRKWFTDEQIAELERRNIKMDDAAYLIRQFYNAETVLSQSDAVLKQLLTDYYKANIETMKAYAQMEQASGEEEIQALSASTVPDTSLYTFVLFPQYGFNKQKVAGTPSQPCKKNSSRNIQHGILVNAA